jgi:hypothetical protein
LRQTKDGGEDSQLNVDHKGTTIPSRARRRIDAFLCVFSTVRAVHHHQAPATTGTVGLFSRVYEIETASNGSTKISHKTTIDAAASTDVTTLRDSHFQQPVEAGSPNVTPMNRDSSKNGDWILQCRSQQRIGSLHIGSPFP